PVAGVKPQLASGVARQDIGAPVAVEVTGSNQGVHNVPALPDGLSRQPAAVSGGRGEPKCPGAVAGSNIGQAVTVEVAHAGDLGHVGPAGAHPGTGQPAAVAIAVINPQCAPAAPGHYVGDPDTAKVDSLDRAHAFPATADLNTRLPST